MSLKEKRIALVTGASSGIGKAVYNDLVGRGWTVYGTSRKIDEGKVEQVNGGKMIYLEVTDKSSIKSAVSIIKAQEGRLDAVINNAGYGIAGAVEDTSDREAKAQFDTNFFGPLTVINESLDLLRESKGIIVNISSVAGIMSIPFQGMYTASKSAMEAISEVLKMELRPYGVRICLVEPGDTKTAFTANRILTEKSSDSDYKARLKASVEKMEKDEQNGTSPETTAKTVWRMIKKKNPPMRVAVGFSYKLLIFLKRLFPDKLVLWILGKMYA